MITAHRNYRMVGKSGLHAHVEVSPLGKLRVDVIETNQHHMAKFEQVKFEKQNKHVRIVNKQKDHPWHIILEESDASELNHLIEDAIEEYEQLMKDL